jgi:uncharacterized secreted protein with C-terminal beta-propeller domain
MKRSWWSGLALFAMAVAVGGSGFREPARRVVTEAVADPVKLVAFESCDTAIGKLRDAARPLVGPYGFGGELRFAIADGMAIAGAPAAAKSEAAVPQDHSTTNNHELGVDEPDLVKTDGRRVVTVADGRLRVIDVASRVITSTVDLPGQATDLLLDGDRALVMTLAGMATPFTANEAIPDEAAPNEAGLTMVDLTGPAKVIGTLAVDGQYIDARQVGGRARIVVRSTPRLGFVWPQDSRSPAEALQENKAILEKASVDDWLPRYRLDHGGVHQEGRLVDCSRVSHPLSYTGTSMLTVLTIEMSRPLGTGDPVSIAADGDTVYGTESSLYIADDHRLFASPLERGLVPRRSHQQTDVYQFDVSQPGPPRYVAAGTVDGTLLNQYSLSEYNGHLRIATTTATESAVTVLARKGNDLAEVGKIGGLGKDERIYAVRFFGALGYVVTFRQTDPLYTMDLSDPAHPRTVGELKINGYSAYLHSAGDGKLIGVGQDADQRGRRSGTQVSLFDVQNAVAPTRAAQYQLTGASSEVEWDPHAFLFRPRTGLVVIPVRESSEPAGALVLRLSGTGFTEVGTVRHPADVRRSLVIGADLWTVSSSGVMVTETTTLTQQSWLAF